LLPAAAAGDQVVIDDEGGLVNTKDDDIPDAVHTLTTRHPGGFSLSTFFSFSSSSSSFMPIFFQIYIIQLYAFLLQFVSEPAEI
jgi:hypothetical protein